VGCLSWPCQGNLTPIPYSTEKEKEKKQVGGRATTNMIVYHIQAFFLSFFLSFFSSRRG